MLHIDIQTIPHQQQRYSTVGDYVTTPDGVVHIRVSELGDWRMEALIAVHEVVEKLLCRKRGITEDEIDAFDLEYERKRAEGDVTSEPGEASDAPYRREHFFATSIERLLAAELGVDWREYEDRIHAL